MLRITAKIIVEWQKRVISDRGGRCHTPVRVRFAPKADIPSRHVSPPLCATSGREQMQQTNVRQCGYSITSSARRRMDVGAVMPIDAAVLRLIARKNFVGCSIGKSPGFAPFSILSTYTAARRNNSVKFGP
jgi:hypothetical protein